MCDGNGIPLGIAIDGANRHDIKLIEETLMSIPIERPEIKPYHRQHLCLDKGYFSKWVCELVQEFEYIPHIRSRGEEIEDLKNHPVKKPRRWVVERTHSWLNRFRAILIRWNKKSQNYLALIHFACAMIIYKKLEIF